MQIEFNKIGAERKALVKAISAIIGENAVYQFMPTCAYEIGCFTVTKDGTLVFDDRIDSEVIESLLEQLAQQGFTPAEANTAVQDAPVGLTIYVPLDKVNCGNLRKSHHPQGWQNHICFLQRNKDQGRSVNAPTFFKSISI